MFVIDVVEEVQGSCMLELATSSSDTRVFTRNASLMLTDENSEIVSILQIHWANHACSDLNIVVPKATPIGMIHQEGLKPEEAEHRNSVDSFR